MSDEATASPLMGPGMTGTVMVRNLSGTAPGGRLGLARMSPDGRIRWSLARVWETARDTPPRRMVWIMLNPAWANWERDDQTIRRCLGYAEREYCNSLAVVNLVPVVGADPGLMLDTLPRVRAWWEPLNTQAIRSALLDAPDPLVACGWGANGAAAVLAPYRATVLSILRGNGITPHVLGVTASGQPVHPLRQRSDAPLIPWDPS